MKNEEIIKEFLTEMATQDNRCTAYPIFYTIRTKVEVHAPLDACEETRYYWNSEEYDSMEDILEYCKDSEFTEEETQRATWEAHEYGISHDWVEKRLFLTESDAKRHLEANHYHYSEDAHTYVNHAWRAPKLEKFFTSLFEHFNIDKPKG